MSDADRITDKRLAEMERELAAMYRRAAKDVGSDLKDYLEKLEPQRKALADAVKSAETPAEKAAAEREYKAFLVGKTINNAEYQRLSEKAAKQILAVNKESAEYVNEQMPSIYASNYNAAGTRISHKVKGYSFDMVDASTVQKLSTSDETLLPYKTVNGQKDVRWNTKVLNSEILQGINAGESIPDMAKRLSHVMGMNAASAVRNARTSTTSAQNKGRMDSYHKAQEQGIKLMKVWLATNDPRTRDAHMELNGQEKEIDEPFENSLGQIMYPGDPNADPANVYNCRCTLITRIVGFGEPANVDVPPDLPEPEVEPPAVEPEPVIPFESEKVKAVLSKADYKEICDRIDKAPTKSLYDKYADSCRDIKKISRHGYYQPGADIVNFSIDKYEGQDRLSTFAHEMAHMFDAHIGRADGLTFNEADMVNSRCGMWGNIVNAVPSQSDGFLTALRNDMKALLPKLKDGTLRNEMLSSMVARNSTSGVQDALDGFYNTQGNGELPWGHGAKYYNRFYANRIAVYGQDKELKKIYTELGFDASNQTKVKMLSRHYEAASEAWANVASATTCGGAELEAIQKYMPETLKEFERICEVLK